MTDTVCDGDCARCYVAAAEQPYGQEWHMADGVMVKEMRIPRAGTIVPQHAHAFDHTSFVARGSVRFWREGEDRGVIQAPHGLFIEAGVKHRFDALEDETVVLCIHNLSRTPGRVEIAAEHNLVGT